jgi:ketosteroid isomerase-like protein
VGTERYIDDEEEGYLVAALHTLGRVRDTGREFDVPEAHLWMVKEGRVVWFKAYIASR